MMFVERLRIGGVIQNAGAVVRVKEEDDPFDRAFWAEDFARFASQNLR